jgi:drug/metabolite transporter (DMT)-like permease
MTAISFAAPLVRYATAPALVIAAWRLLFSTGMVAGIAGLSNPSIRTRLGEREALLALAAGASLAGHFWAWVAAVQLTTVAAASVLVATSPLFLALLSLAVLHERPGGREWAGIALAFAGAVWVGAAGGDGAGTALGNGLALLSALLVAIYLLVGRALRESMDLWRYVTLVYGTAGLLLALSVLVLPGTSLFGHPATDWMVFAALAAGPMLIGHTGLNYAVRRIPAHLVGLAVLSEPVGATILAWVLPGIRETPPPAVLMGGALVLAGIALGLSGTKQEDAGPRRTG